MFSVIALTISPLLLLSSLNRIILRIVKSTMLWISAISPRHWWGDRIIMTELFNQTILLIRFICISVNRWIWKRGYSHFWLHTKPSDYGANLPRSLLNILLPLSPLFKTHKTCKYGTKSSILAYCYRKWINQWQYCGMKWSCSYHHDRIRLICICYSCVEWSIYKACSTWKHLLRRRPIFRVLLFSNPILTMSAFVLLQSKLLWNWCNKYRLDSFKQSMRVYNFQGKAVLSLILLSSLSVHAKIIKLKVTNIITHSVSSCTYFCIYVVVL